MIQDFRFIHAADLHLDSPMLGLESYPDAPIEVLRDATRIALRNLVDLCIEEKVAFLLIAGDVYDGDWKSLGTGRFFADQMARLKREDIPVFLIKGNHDAASQVSREIIAPGTHTFDHKRPETVLLDTHGVAIHGQSFAQRAVLEDLSSNYPDPVPGYLNIGLLHTSASGTSSLHEAYAPCNVNDLVRRGYDYWALGHVHQREVLCADPPVIFPGNIQGRHVREHAIEGKGVTLVEVKHGRIESFTHQPLDTIRWKIVDVDVSGAQSVQEVINRIGGQIRIAVDLCEGRLLAVRIIVSGRTDASLAIRKDIESFEQSVRTDVQGAIQEVWIEEIRVQTQANALGEIVSGQGSLGDLLEFIRNASEEQLAEPQAKLAALRDRIRLTSPDVVNDLELDAPDLLASLLPEVEEAILSLSVGDSK